MNMRAGIINSATLLVVLAFACLFVALPPMYAAAYAMGSITLTCNVNRDEVDVPLAGDTYEFSLVAAAPGVAYETTGPFASIGCEWGGLDAGQLRSKAREAAELAARKGIAADATGSTDAQGKISAQGLRLGMYLVRRVAVASANDRTLDDPTLFRSLCPRLWAIPLNLKLSQIPRWKSKGLFLDQLIRACPTPTVYFPGLICLQRETFKCCWSVSLRCWADR